MRRARLALLFVQMEATLMSDHDYNIGYFEGMRNALISYVRMPNKEQWLAWLEAELKDAKELRDNQ